MQTKWFSLSLTALCLPLLASLALVGCPDDNNDKAQAGQACKVDADCQESLLCRANVCTSPTTTDMSSGDMGGDMQGDMNTSTVKAEDYYISYIKLSEVGENSGDKFMYVLDTSTNTSVQVSEDANLCAVTCWMTRDLKTFVYMRQSSAKPGTFDVYTTAVGDGFKVSGTGTVLIDGAERVEVLENLIYFVREENGNKKAYYTKPDSTTPKLISDLGSAAATQGSANLSGEANKVVIFKPTLQDLEIAIGDLDGTVSDVYTLDGRNYQEVGGSFFGSNIPTTFSKDGKYMAMLTSAPNNYNTCQSDGDCSGVGQHCGNQKLCTAIEVSVHFFDLENLDKLGENCDSDAKCGGVHECYIPSSVALDKAKCIPRRIAVGVPSTPLQPKGSPNAQEGCANTAGNAKMPYTRLTPPMSFDNQGNLYIAAQRECGGKNGEINIADTDILQMSPTSNDFKVVYGNPGKDFSDALCYNEVESKIDVENCIIYVKSVHLSPGGNELTFMGTNPNTQDSSKASVAMDVWSVLRDGTKHEWNGNNGLFDRVQRFWVHPK